MGEAFMNFFEMVKNASYGFMDIINGVVGLWADICANQHIVVLRDCITPYLDMVAAYLPFILLALYAVVAFFGERLFGILRFLSFFATGFILGVYWLSPLVLEIIPTLPTWVIGTVAGIVAAVLSKALYFIALVVVAGYSAYLVSMSGMVLPSIAGNYIVGIIVMAVAVVLVIVLRKFIARFGTAMLGGFGIATVVRGWYDYTTLSPFVGREWLGVLVATLIVALIGFAVQHKIRERY